MKFKKIGLRNLKTALAVALAIFLSQVLNLRSPFFAGIAAIAAMQSSVSESFSSGIARMLSTILGGIIALLFSILAPENPFSIGLGIVIIIYVCNLFGWKQSVSLSGMVFLSIILNYQEGSRVDYAFYRTSDTLFGLIVGTLVNYFVLPFNLENKMVGSVEKMYKRVKNIVGALAWKEGDLDLENLRRDLIVIEKDYELLKKEIRFNLYKSETFNKLTTVFDLLEGIYSNLILLCSLGKNRPINLENKEALEGIFGKALPDYIPDYKGDTEIQLDLVYNYHLKNLIDNLKKVHEILYA